MGGNLHQAAEPATAANEGPNVGGPHAPYRHSQRGAIYPGSSVERDSDM